MDSQTVLTNTIEYAASAGAIRNNKELNKIKAIMKQLEASVTNQAATVETFSTKTNGSISGSRKTTDKKKASPGLHVCAHCKHELYYKDSNCLELEANKSKRCPGCNIVFTKE